MKTMYFEKYTRLNKIVKLGKYSYYMQKNIRLVTDL